MRNLILKTAAWRQAHREEGQGVVEYGLVVALVSLVIIGLLATLGSDILAAVGDAVDAKLPL
jgi:Flp pilus assembly pilin Flp